MSLSNVIRLIARGMDVGDSEFQKFTDSFPEIAKFHPQTAYEKFAIAEFKRFHSIAGTMLASFQNVKNSIDERRMTHILLRSLLEAYFWLLYIFDKPDDAARSSAFEQYLNGFKNEYAKLYNEKDLAHKDKIDKPDPTWKNLPTLKMNAVVTAVKNIYGTRLDFLYTLYRITSFDTHGKSNEAVFEAAFGKAGNFPFLDIPSSINLIANGYLVIWRQISPLAKAA